MLFNKFEFKYKNKFLYIYNYIKIKKLKPDFITIEYDSGNLSVKGSKIIIQELYKEYMVISGNISEIDLVKEDNND